MSIEEPKELPNTQPENNPSLFNPAELLAGKEAPAGSPPADIHLAQNSNSSSAPIGAEYILSLLNLRRGMMDGHTRDHLEQLILDQLNHRAPTPPPSED